MFRLITAAVPEPRLWLLCDRDNCCAVAEGSCDLSDPQASERSFLTQAQTAGWTIALLGQLCPSHTKEARIAAAEHQQAQEKLRQERANPPLVQLADLADARALDRRKLADGLHFAGKR